MEKEFENKIYNFSIEVLKVEIYEKLQEKHPDSIIERDEFQRPLEVEILRESSDLYGNNFIVDTNHDEKTCFIRGQGEVRFHVKHENGSRRDRSEFKFESFKIKFDSWSNPNFSVLSKPEIFFSDI